MIITTATTDTVHWLPLAQGMASGGEYDALFPGSSKLRVSDIGYANFIGP